MCVSFLLLSFKLRSGCLFSPHYVNQGGVQKPTPQVTLYESHTAEESLRRRRSSRHSHRVCSPCFPKTRVFFLFLFLKIFLLVFLVREDPNSADVYCCTYREDAGNRFPLCEGEVDFIDQVPNLICYQLLINQASYQ